jgi:hypothetical protein
MGMAWAWIAVGFIRPFVKEGKKRVKETKGKE